MVSGGGGEGGRGVPAMRNAGPSISHTLSAGPAWRGLKGGRQDAGVFFITTPPRQRANKLSSPIGLIDNAGRLAQNVK